MTASLLGRDRIGPSEARILVDSVRRLSGLSVAESKVEFLEHRVYRLLRDTGVPTVSQYIEQLRLAPTGPAAQRLVEALTTHTTSFFRERAHYNWLESRGLPERIQAGAGQDWPLVVWSAACSTGAELWSAGMLVDDVVQRGNRALRWELVGTDVSRKILQKAAEATFDAEEIEPISEAYRRRYLLRSSAKLGGPTLFRIAPELRRRARLARLNLLDLPAGLSVTADVVFLRNVLIYFEPENQLRAVANVARRLRLGGFLITGHSESLATVPPGLALVAPSIYQKR